MMRENQLPDHQENRFGLGLASIHSGWNTTSPKSLSRGPPAGATNQPARLHCCLQEESATPVAGGHDAMLVSPAEAFLD